MSYALRALESGGRQVGRDASSFFNDERRCVSAAASYDLMEQNKKIQAKNDLLTQENQKMKLEMQMLKQQPSRSVML